MTLPERLGWLRVSSLWVYRILTAFVLAIGLTFAGVVLGLRYWILPNVGAYREDIARIATERTRQKVTIGSISASWDGLRPQLVLELKKRIGELCVKNGASHLQVGKDYPYLQTRKPAVRELVRQLKTLLDPQGLMNPGALGL